MSICGDIHIVNKDASLHTYVSLPCKSWLCDDCAPCRKKRLIAELAAGKPDMFLTFTIRKIAGRTAEQAARDLIHAFQVLKKRLSRKTKGRKFPHMVVIEAHESGEPHIHVLARSKFIDQKWLSATMEELIDSPIVGIERLTNPAKLFNYCAKYAGKCAAKFGNCKRYWKSRDYDLRDEEERRPFQSQSGMWDRTYLTLVAVRQLAHLERWTIWLDEGREIVVDTHQTYSQGPPS